MSINEYRDFLSKRISRQEKIEHFWHFSDKYFLALFNGKKMIFSKNVVLDLKPDGSWSIL